jgi:hypothetical protein
MNRMTRGLILAGIQLAIVAGLGAKLAFDRARLPRAWAKVRSYDPDLPIRGRYLSLQLVVPVQPATGQLGGRGPGYKNPCNFEAGLVSVDGKLQAIEGGKQTGILVQGCGGVSPTDAMIIEPVVFFLPERADDPLRMARGGELWAEVTIPKKGPPRPIRLAVKNGGRFTPLEVK